MKDKNTQLGVALGIVFLFLVGVFLIRSAFSTEEKKPEESISRDMDTVPLPATNEVDVGAVPEEGKVNDGYLAVVESPYAVKSAKEKEEEAATEEECGELVAHMRALDAKEPGQRGAFSDPEAVEFLSTSCKNRTVNAKFVKCALGASSMKELPDCMGFDPDQSIADAERQLQEIKRERAMGR